MHEQPENGNRFAYFDTYTICWSGCLLLFPVYRELVVNEASANVQPSTVAFRCLDKTRHVRSLIQGKTNAAVSLRVELPALCEIHVRIANVLFAMRLPAIFFI